jgi:hypothetical protein
VPGEEFERHYAAGAVADHDGRECGREVFDKTRGIICIGLEALRVIFRAGQVALREASSLKAVSWCVRGARLLYQSFRMYRGKHTIVKHNRKAILQLFAESSPDFTRSVAPMDA